MDFKPQNCWEVLNCGQGPDNPDSTCPVPRDTRFAGVNDGVNAGRYCWMQHGTLCDTGIGGAFYRKPRDCVTCPFFRQVEQEQGRAFVFVVITTPK